MRNYISVNAKYYTAKQISKISDHNERLAAIDYLLDEKYRKFKNLEKIICDNNQPKATSIEGNFKNLYAQMKQMKRDRKANRGSKNDIIDAVVSLSEEKALFYLNQKNGEEKLLAAFETLALDIKDQYGLEPIGISLHTDEGWKGPEIYDIKTKKEVTEVKYNIHAHIDFLNFDFKTGKSVLRNLRLDDWRFMQDVAQESFQKNDLDFIRGEKKKITGKEHLEKNDFVIAQQESKLKILEEKAKSYQQTIDVANKFIIEREYHYKKLNEMKNKYKELRANFDIGSEKYKNLSVEIKKLQAEEKTARAEHKKAKAELDDLKKDNVDFQKLLSHEAKINKELEEKKNKLEDVKKDIEVSIASLDAYEIMKVNLKKDVEDLELVKKTNIKANQHYKSFINQLKSHDSKKFDEAVRVLIDKVKHVVDLEEENEKLNEIQSKHSFNSLFFNEDFYFNHVPILMFVAMHENDFIRKMEFEKYLKIAEEEILRDLAYSELTGKESEMDKNIEIISDKSEFVRNFLNKYTEKIKYNVSYDEDANRIVEPTEEYAKALKEAQEEIDEDKNTEIHEEETSAPNILDTTNSFKKKKK